MKRRPPRSTLFPTRRSSDLKQVDMNRLVGRGQPELAAHVEPQGIHFLQQAVLAGNLEIADRKSTRLNSSHSSISYAVFCLKKKKIKEELLYYRNTIGANLRT